VNHKVICTSLDPSSSGFTLFIALNLMAFIVLLFLPLQTLIRAELLTNSNFKVRMVALQNALTALNISLAELRNLSTPPAATPPKSKYLSAPLPSANGEDRDDTYQNGAIL